MAWLQVGEVGSLARSGHMCTEPARLERSAHTHVLERAGVCRYMAQEYPVTVWCSVFNVGAWPKGPARQHALEQCSGTAGVPASVERHRADSRFQASQAQS